MVDLGTEPAGGRTTIVVNVTATEAQDINDCAKALASTDIAQVSAGPRIPLESLVEEGLRPLAERRVGAKILVDPRVYASSGLRS